MCTCTCVCVAVCVCNVLVFLCSIFVVVCLCNSIIVFVSLTHSNLHDWSCTNIVLLHALYTPCSKH